MAENVRRDEIYLSQEQLLERVRRRMPELVNERFDEGGLDVLRAAEALHDDACDMGGQCSNSPAVIAEAVDVAAKALLIVMAQSDEEEGESNA